jgi:hypothetical protein
MLSGGIMIRFEEDSKANSKGSMFKFLRKIQKINFSPKNG